jgi:uncharacterized Zn finger protein
MTSPSPEKSENPITEASPLSLNELFSRDPEKYSDQDLDLIIEELRKQRQRHMQLEAVKVDEAPRKRAAAKPKAEKMQKIDGASVDQLFDLLSGD